MYRRFCRLSAHVLAPVAMLVALLASGEPAHAQLKPLPSAMRPATEFVGPSVTRPIIFAEPNGEAMPAGYERAALSTNENRGAIVAVPIGQATFAPSGEESGIFEPIYASPAVGGAAQNNSVVNAGVVDSGEGAWYYDHEPWTVQFFPNGLVYRSYLAGVKEPRFGVQIFHEKDDGWLWDVTLGGRVGLLRYGTSNGAKPEGFQIDMEGAAFPRLDPESQMDLNAADFRFGIPFTYGVDKWQAKFAYYHLSSHLGDEYVFRNHLTTRYNYARDAIVLGLSYFVLPSVRLYAEADWAFYQDVARPWAFQFGAEYSPQGATGMRGTPFVALNGHLRQELDYSGNVVAQAGWQWRSTAGHLMRIGLHYYNGLNPQFALFDDFEEQIGAGLWYDY
jgi:hypothetical protein